MMADILVYLASSAALKYFLQSKGTQVVIPGNARLVGRVKGIYIYPVKSMRGIEIKGDGKNGEENVAHCTDAGLQYKQCMDR